MAAAFLLLRFNALFSAQWKLKYNAIMMKAGGMTEINNYVNNNNYDNNNNNNNKSKNITNLPFIQILSESFRFFPEF